MSQGQAFWERDDWDELPYSAKAAEVNAWLQRVGYDPVEARHQDEHRRLQEHIDQLEHRIEQLELQLKRWIDSGAAAAKERLDGQREQRY